MITTLLIIIAFLLVLVVILLDRVQKNQITIAQALTQGNATIHKEIRKINDKI